MTGEGTFHLLIAWWSVKLIAWCLSSGVPRVSATPTRSDCLSFSSMFFFLSQCSYYFGHLLTVSRPPRRPQRRPPISGGASSETLPVDWIGAEASSSARQTGSVRKMKRIAGQVTNEYSRQVSWGWQTPQQRSPQLTNSPADFTVILGRAIISDLHSHCTFQLVSLIMDDRTVESTRHLFSPVNTCRISFQECATSPNSTNQSYELVPNYKFLPESRWDQRIITIH